MSYINNELGGSQTDYNKYFNYYWLTFNRDPMECLKNGVDFCDINTLISNCFDIGSETIGIKDNIDNGLPIIFGAYSRYLGKNAQGVDVFEGHCMAIIGYSSNRKYMIIDPIFAEVRMVYLYEILNFLNRFLYFVPINKSKGLPG